MGQQYDESAIQVLEGLEAVRKRPGMYIGSTDGRGLHHLVYEIVDNAIDEALAGYGRAITVTIQKDNSIRVSDEGRGVPTGMHASGRPTPEVIFTVLHAGGKFGQGGYKTSGGLHGVGSSVVNALSEWLEVEIDRDGKKYRQRFEHGGKPATTLLEVGVSKKTGTTVTFKPDPKIFSTIEYNYNTLRDRLRESAFLITNLKMTLHDQRTNQKEEFIFDNGLYSFVHFLNENKTLSHEQVFSFTGEASEIEVDFAFQYTQTYNETFYSFVNNVRTKDGGTHETGAKSAITKALNEYARKYALLKEKDKNLDGADVREGITAVLSVRIPEKYLQFEGQTKSKLGTPQARSAIEQVVIEQLNFIFEENKELATELIKKAIRAQMAREAARKAREEIRLGKKKSKKDTILSGK
ncbi:MAG: ATP-binding protein, partial [Culicoidibacterales bacterium]